MSKRSQPIFLLAAAARGRGALVHWGARPRARLAGCSAGGRQAGSFPGGAQFLPLPQLNGILVLGKAWGRNDFAKCEERAHPRRRGAAMSVAYDAGAALFIFYDAEDEASTLQTDVTM